MARPPDSTPEQIAAFGQALTDELNTRGFNQAELVRRYEALTGETVHQTTVSRWVAGAQEPSRRQAVTVEAALDLPPGLLTRHLGYVPTAAAPAVDLVAAINAAADLAPGDRALLLDMYTRLRTVEHARRQKR